MAAQKFLARCSKQAYLSDSSHVEKKIAEAKAYGFGRIVRWSVFSASPHEDKKTKN